MEFTFPLNFPVKLVDFLKFPCKSYSKCLVIFVLIVARRSVFISSEENCNLFAKNETVKPLPLLATTVKPSEIAETCKPSASVISS